MKITLHVLSIPPYISTTWQHIAALNVQERGDLFFLIIELVRGDRIEIPHLDQVTIEKIFSMHAAYNDAAAEVQKPTDGIQKNNLPPLLTFRMSKNFLGEGIEKIASVLQHNPEAADSADLPKEMLDNVATIAQSLGVEDISAIPHPVAGCNCFFCQISRTILTQILPSPTALQTANEEEEEVSEDDLRFKNWDICQKDSTLYEVINPLDTQEYYTVFLGEPLGCTCGHTHCEHIRAVLRS